MLTLERRPSFLTLKQALAADAVVSGAVGVLSFAGARWLDSVLDLPPPLLAGSGAIAMAYAGGLMRLGTRTPVPIPGVRSVVGGNLVWAAMCVVLLFSGWIEPNALGVAFILMHLVGALVLAGIQALALRV